jgi:hypothetical protein
MRIKWIVLKFVEDIPEDTLPTHSPNVTGSITGFNIPSNWVGIVLVIGIEISMGFDRSTLMFSIVAIIIFNHTGQ